MKSSPLHISRVSAFPDTLVTCHRYLWSFAIKTICKAEPAVSDEKHNYKLLTYPFRVEVGVGGEGVLHQ